MTFTVGGVDVTAVNVGATPAQAVYLGDVKVWPTATAPPMTEVWTIHMKGYLGPNSSESHPPAGQFNGYQGNYVRLARPDADGQQVQAELGDPSKPGVQVLEVWTSADPTPVVYQEHDYTWTVSADRVLVNSVPMHDQLQHQLGRSADSSAELWIRLSTRP